MSTLEILVTIYSIGVVWTFVWALAYSAWLLNNAGDLGMVDFIEQTSTNRIKIAKLDDQAKRLMKYSPIISIFWPIILVLVFVVTISKNK